MPRMTNVDIDFISLVNKGANKQKINIYKSDDFEEPETDSNNDEVAGFFNVMKSYFLGNKTIGKAEEQATVTSFADRMAASDITENMWRVNDTLRATLREIINSKDIKDKQASMSKAVDEFAAYMKSKIKEVKVQKSANYFEDPEVISKAGKKISNKRLLSLKEAQKLLNKIIEDVSEESEENEGVEDEVNKEELQKILKDAIGESIKPIEERLGKIEKGDNGQDDNGETSSEDIATIIKSAISEAVDPINQRLATVEKSRGISAQVDDEDGNDNHQTVKKSLFTGIQI